jgi:PAS domain S-box-containing protein
MFKQFQQRMISAESIDPLDAYTRQAIQSVLAITLMTLIGIIIVDTLLGDHQPIIIALSMVAVFVAISMVLLRWNYAMPARVLVPIVLLIALCYSITIGYGIHDIAIMGLPILFMVASLTLGKNAPLVFGITAIIAICIIGGLEQARIITTPTNIVTTADEIILIAVLILMSASLQRILLNRIEESLKQSRDKTQAQIELNAEMRELQGILVDRVRELKETEDALRKNEIRYRALFERTNDAVFLIGLDNKIITVNSQVLKMLGYTEQEMVGYPSTIFIVPEEQSANISRHKELVDGETLPLYERTFMCKDGTHLQAELNVAMVFDDDGKPLHIQSVVRNITERKRAEDALRKSEAMYRRAIEAIGGVPYINDYEKHCFSFMGEGVRDLTGYSPAEMSPDLWQSLRQAIVMLGEANGTSREDAIERARAGELKTWCADNLIVTKDGQTRWVMDSAVQIPNDNGIPVASIGILQDVTERHRIQTEQARLIGELESKNAELERFAYTVSHDLKAPLITIRGFLGYLEKDFKSGDWERIQSDLLRIVQATDKMQQLLNDLLELSRIGRLMNAPENVPGNDIVHDAIELVRGRLNAQHIQVTVADHLPIVRGDRVRLVEVIQNLVDNAAKFTSTQSQPHIEIGSNGFELDKPVLYVRDNGIGIESQFHERVFGLFNKLDSQTEGTGVGLALVKRIIEVHGGRIWVESEGLGKGSTFYFTLPRATADAGGMDE